MPVPDENALSPIPKAGEQAGGSGGPSRSDARLVLQAVNQRWMMTNEQRDRLIRRALDMLEETDDARACASLVQALGKLDELNLAQETGGKVGSDVTVRVVYEPPKPLPEQG